MLLGCDLDATWMPLGLFCECVKQMLIIISFGGCMLLGCELGKVLCYLVSFVNGSDKCPFLLVLMAVCCLDATWERSYATWAFL